MIEALVTALPQLGIAGVAMLILYLQHRDASLRAVEKDVILMKEVEKHQKTQDNHLSYMREVHATTMAQLQHASRVIEENTRAYSQVIKHLEREAK